MRTVPTIPSSTWNKLIKFLIKHRVLGVTFISDGSWRHPWNVQPVYNAAEGLWMGDIMAGFVNEHDASVQLPARLAPAETVERLRRLGSMPSDGDTSVDGKLSEGAMIPLTAWRAIGGDASPSSATSSAEGDSVTLSFESVPPFFLDLGVAPPPRDITLDFSGSSKNVAAAQDVVNRRLLRAADLVLYQDRFGTSTQWTSGAGVDGSFAQFNVLYHVRPDARKEPYIRTTPKWTPPLTAVLRDMVAGNWTDEMRDEKHLATVYLVSPVNTPQGSEPDGTWTPYVEHKIFWNLRHDTNHLRPQLADLFLQFNTGLAGGVGDAVNNLILAQINDANSAASQVIGREAIEGRFWTV